MIPCNTDRARLRADLLAFYDRERRDLPWRDEPDPYRVWVSEVMLQQTRVETVIPYYLGWMERFPTLDRLARASDEEVLKAWEGLGYYSRAQRLHRGARVVRERLRGHLPESAEGLRALPGVGEYTAGAVASIAFGQVTPAVDGNVRRVLARLFDLEDPSPKELRELAGALVDPERPGDFNQALMELGATVCTPRAPACEACPLRSWCVAAAAGTQLSRPTPKRKRSTPTHEFAVAVVSDGEGRLVLRRRPRKGLLAGLWEFPNAAIPGSESAEAVALRVAVETLEVGDAPAPTASGALDAIRHTLTHFKAVYWPFAYRVGGAHARAPGSWISRAEAAQKPMPVPQRRILQRWIAEQD